MNKMLFLELLDFKEGYYPVEQELNIDEILNFKINYSNRSDFLEFLKNKYIVHPHTRNKIIIYDNSNYCYKIGISNNFLKDPIFKEKEIYEQAKRNNLDIFFEPIELLGYFKHSPKNGLYRQKKLIVFSDWNYDEILFNWKNLYGKDKILEFNEFLNKYCLYDLNPPNIGYDPDLNTYKLIDYEICFSGERDGHKTKFNNALNNLLKE